MLMCRGSGFWWKFEKVDEYLDEDAKVEQRKSERWWVVGYEAGDVVFHYPFSIHASCSDQDGEAGIRLSTD